MDGQAVLDSNDQKEIGLAVGTMFYLKMGNKGCDGVGYSLEGCG
jgi:hypothetical protein